MLLSLSFIYLDYGFSKEKLVAELFESKIDIDVGFTGATISIFGMIDEEGDVVVTVTGPRKKIVVRKKENNMGIWINGSTKVFSDVPSFYYVASNKPLEKLNAETSLHVNQIGLKNLRFEGAEENERKDRKLWIDGIVNTMVKQGRYSDKIGKIEISKNKLFKTELYFSSDILEGEYINQPSGILINLHGIGSHFQMIIDDNRSKARAIISEIENYNHIYPIGEYNWKLDGEIAKKYLLKY